MTGSIEVSGEGRTTATGVHPRHDREGTTVVGYAAYQRLAVTVRDTGLVGSVLEAFAGAAGNALTVDDLRLELADPAPVLARAPRPTGRTPAPRLCSMPRWPVASSGRSRPSPTLSPKDPLRGSR